MAAWVRCRRSLVNHLHLCLDKCSRGAVRVFLHGLTAGQLPALQSLELRCAPPAGKDDSPRLHTGHHDLDWEEAVDYLDEGTTLSLRPAFSRLSSLTSLSASGFSYLHWLPGCLPASLHSLTIDLYPAHDWDSELVASGAVPPLAQAAGKVSALQSLSIELAQPRVDTDGYGDPDERYIRLAALREPWARQLTQLSLIGHGRVMNLEHLAGLSNLQQLRLGAEYLRCAFDMADEHVAQERWQQPSLGPLGALTQLRRVRLDGMDLLDSEKLQPVWSLPCLEGLDVANLRNLRPNLSSQHTLDGCKARHLVVSYQLAATLGPMLGPLEHLEQLTIADVGGCLGHPVHFSPNVLRVFASQCPGLRRVECVFYGRTPSDVTRQALSAMLPVGVELVLRVAGAAFFFPKACDRDAEAAT